MTVRFKCQSEYQKSYRSRSRSVSPQRSTPFAGLRSDQMGIIREPCLQRRKKLDPGGLTKSCSSLIFPPEPKITQNALKTAPPAAKRKESPKPPTPPRAGVDPESTTQPETPAGPRPSADPVPPADLGAAENSVQPQPSKPDNQSQPSRPLTAAPDRHSPSSNEVQHALRWKAGMRSRGQRSGVHRSEYNRQFSWKKPITSASPLLTAEQVLYSSSRSVPPFKKHPVTVETEYNRSFKGAVPPTGPRLRKHLEQQRIPLFHTHMTNKKRREDSEKKPHPTEEVSSPMKDAATPPPPPQVQRGHRTATEYESSFRSPLLCRIPEEGEAKGGDAPQVTELRQKALSYRQRAWGTHFSRDHLSQLLSDHNALWEPTDTTSDSAADPSSPRAATSDPDSCGASHVEALELPSRSSNSSKKSSVVEENVNRNSQNKAQTPQSPGSERRTAWAEKEEEEKTDEEEGRLPTPRLKLLPVQRTHHDLTTPATGGAILVGKLRGSGGSSPNKQRSVSAVSMAEGAEPAPPSKPKEAWSDDNHSHNPSPGPSPQQKQTASPSSKPIRAKQTTPSPAAPPPLHGFQGTLRHPDFQHNGELGLRFREAPCPGGGCGSDEDDRLSVMSWRSAASCSMASAVLERAQRRRENFWGKR